MKLHFRPSQVLPHSPLFIQNVCPAGAFRPWATANTRVRPAGTPVLNGELLATSKSYGILSQCRPAPAPSLAPMGVEAVGSGSEARRRAANDAARAELLRASPNPDVLRAYSGGGGIGESINEYYTPGRVVSAMYAAFGTHLGKEPLRVLDLACGIGNLLAQAPEGSEVVGVELDPTSAAIARLLLPHAAIHNVSAEQYVTQSVDPLFDLCVINPPYGPRTALHHDPESKGIRSNEHYFVQKAVERVKHGSGIVVALVNMNLAGGEAHDLWRHRIAMHGQVLHTVVVPRQAFEMAGAGVTTVILVIRRHDVGVREALGTLTMPQLQRVLGEYEGYESGFYTGKMVYSKDPYRGDYHLSGNHNSHRRLGDDTKLKLGRFDQPEYDCPLVADDKRLEVIRNHVTCQRQPPAPTLAQVLGQIGALFGDAALRAATRASGKASVLPIPLGTTNPDHTWVVTPEGWKPNDDFADPVIADALTIAAVLNGLENANSTQLLHVTKRLQTMNRVYLERHGPFPRQRLTRLAARVPMLGLVVAYLNADNALEVRVPPGRALQVSGTPEQVAAQLADLMLLTEDSLCEHSGCSRAEAEAHLAAHYCWNGQVWTPPGVYYAGNAVLKSERCRLDAQQEEGLRQQALLRQAAEFLRRIQPATLEELRLTPRDTTIPVAVLEAWVNNYLDTVKEGRHLISVERVSGVVKFLLATRQTKQENLQNRRHIDENAVKELNAYLNFGTRMPRIEGAKDMTKEEYHAERAAAMDETREYEERLAMHFQSWLPGSGHSDSVLQSYNLARRSYLVPDGITDPLPLQDWRGPDGHPFQCMDVRTLAASDGMILGYDVGLGKTYTALMLIAYLRMLGQANRPVIVVPAGLIGNWSTNAQRALPDWKVISIGMSPVFNADGTPKYKKKRDGSLMTDEQGNPVQVWSEDNAAKKRVKLAQVAAGQANLVIMSREAFTGIPMSEANTLRLIAEDAQFTARIEAAENFDERGRKNRFDVLLRQERFTAACHARLKQASQSDILFERFGFDLLVFDECHAYKNLYSAPSAYGETPKFLGAGAESNRALDAVFKGRYIRGQGGKTYGLTASWVKNSPLEIHSMINLISDDLPMFGLATNESLMEQYLRIEPRIITTLDGDVSVRPAVVGFQRLQELKSVRDAKIIVRKAGDKAVVRRDGKPLHVPVIRVEEVTFDMSPEQLDLYKTYRQQALQADGYGKGEDHTFSVMWRMRKLTADPRLLGHDFPNPRFEEFAQQALRVRAMGLKSLGFLSIGEQDGSFERLKATLVRAGYPEHEIEIVSSGSHKSSVARQDLEDRYNYGDLTLIIGSEVLAEGFNLQHGTGAIIHADILWNHDGIKQRNGRGGRQGNVLDEVLCIYLLQRGSFDTVTYTIMSGKKGWKDQLDGQADEAENSGAEFGADEIAILMSEDPDLMRVRIEEKKKELAEASGHAAFRRKLSAVYRACLARRHLQLHLGAANGRKHGWTAMDFLRVANARRSLQRVLLDVDDPSVFPLAQLTRYRGLLQWSHGLPVHRGLSFTYQDSRVEVHSFDLNGMTVKRLGGSGPQMQTLALRDVARLGKDFQPSRDEHDYDPQNVPQIEVELALLLSPDLKVYVMNGPTTKPAPQDGSALTVLVRGNNVETLSDTTPERLRGEFSRGHTVIHYLTRETKAGLVLEHVVVLCPNRATTQQTASFKDQPDFHERLKAVAQMALSA